MTTERFKNSGLNNYAKKTILAMEGSTITQYDPLVRYLLNNGIE